MITKKRSGKHYIEVKVGDAEPKIYESIREAERKTGIPYRVLQPKSKAKNSERVGGKKYSHVLVKRHKKNMKPVFKRRKTVSNLHKLRARIVEYQEEMNALKSRMRELDELLNKANNERRAEEKSLTEQVENTILPIGGPNNAS